MISDRGRQEIKCPICEEQGKETREAVDEKDLRGHLRTMHRKPEISAQLAKVLWEKSVTTPPISQEKTEEIVNEALDDLREDLQVEKKLD